MRLPSHNKGTHDIAESDDVEKGGGKALGRRIVEVLVGEDRGSLHHALGELAQLLHGFHLLRDKGNADRGSDGSIGTADSEAEISGEERRWEDR